MALKFIATLLSAAAMLANYSADAWVAPIVVKGNKFFNSETGKEFRIKGMAYYPRPNGGELADVSNYDYVTDEHEAIWRPHLKIMKDLGVNTIRLYSVDPSKSHDKFMCACSDAGIYVMVGMAAPCKDCAIQDLEPPKCYPDHMFERVQIVYNAFAPYDNTLLFSVGNENNLQRSYEEGGMQTAPCVKALIRDTRNYAASCASDVRQVPIGLHSADIKPREKFLQYYDCVIDDNEFTRAEWYGSNPYVECDPIKHTKYEDSTGLQQLMKEYNEAQYSRPLMFGEYGCQLGENTIDGYENQRAFHDAKWMNTEKEMTNEIVGGNVFEFTTEKANTVAGKLTKKADTGKYGVGYFSPDDCDHDKIPCKFMPYPEYDNLKKAYTTTEDSTLTMDDFEVTRKDILECPGNMASKLPPMPKVDALMCESRQPKCKGEKSNNFDKVDNPVKLGEKTTPSNTKVVGPEDTELATTESDGTASVAMYTAAWTTIAAVVALF